MNQMHVCMCACVLTRIVAIFISLSLLPSIPSSSSSASSSAVPGMTRAVIPILRAKGITAISVGANTYSASAAVPRIYNWTHTTTTTNNDNHSSSSNSIIALQHPGGYGDGDTVSVPGCSHALALLFNGDNAGPHSPQQVR